MSDRQENETASASDEETDEMMQTVIDAVANHGAEKVIRALSDACYIAAAVAEEEREFGPMGELTFYAHTLEKLPIHRS